MTAIGKDAPHSGRALSGQALAVPVEPVSRLDPSGFDPARIEVRDEIARIIRRELIDEHSDPYNPERGTRHYDVLVLGCAEVNYVDPEDAAQQFAFLTADAIVAHLQAIATEAGTAETPKDGSVHEGAVPERQSPKDGSQ